MRRIRSYIDQPLAGLSELQLPEAPSHHLLRVLRLRPGAQVFLFDGSGGEFPAEILDSDSPKTCRVRLSAAIEPAVESALHITLHQAIGRGERMDWAIQKATELGVSRIQPILSERTEVRLDAKRGEKRRLHWQQVAVAAAEQSGRVRLPVIEPPVPLDTLKAEADVALFLDPASGRGLGDLRPAANGRYELVIGPEGGLSDSEVKLLESRGFDALRLGPRVMRTETAGPVMIALLQAHFGDLR
ncbi:MAG: 16S rRNA (uracil(1498)-N(3))-methyltransferase [Wenzhouxiangella sp.]